MSDNFLALTIIDHLFTIFHFTHLNSQSEIECHAFLDLILRRQSLQLHGVSVPQSEGYTFPLLKVRALDWSDKIRYQNEWLRRCWSERFFSARPIGLPLLIWRGQRLDRG